MFIQTQTQTQTKPKPSYPMFYSVKPVMAVGSADFPNVQSALGSPLVKANYSIDGVVRVFFGSDFVTVTKSDDVSWDILKPEIFAVVPRISILLSNLCFWTHKLLLPMILPLRKIQDSETMALIKELLESRIRPAFQADGTLFVWEWFSPPFWFGFLSSF